MALFLQKLQLPEESSCLKDTRCFLLILALFNENLHIHVLLSQRVAQNVIFVPQTYPMLETSLSRIQWTFRVLLMAMLGTWLLSNKVWMTDRNFPVVPIFDGIPSLPSPIDYIFYSILIVLAIYQIIYLENRNTKIALIALLGFLMLGDQMRWQPYNVQYFLMIVGLFFYPKYTDGLLNTFRMMVVVFLIYSGIQEVNSVFIESIFPWMIKPIAVIFPAKMEPYILGGGYIFPFLSIAAGIGLLFNQTRNYAVYLGMFVNLFYFYALSPMGNDWNHAILPYNIAMTFFTYVLFFNTELSFEVILWSKKFRYQQVLVVFFAGLPLLSLFGVYDRMQSFNTYSGKSLYAKIYVTESLVNLLPDGVKRYVYRPPQGEPYIETTYWSADALKVSPYSEERVYEKLHEYVCSFSEGDCSARLEIYSYGGR
jgi:hypothetical protein